MKKPIRQIALEVLLKLERGEGYSDEFVNEYIDYFEDYRDFNLLRNIVYGVLERYYTLGFYYRSLVKDKLPKDKKVNTIIKMALYELLFLDRSREYAVINEAVELVKTTNTRMASFANAILRNFLRSRIELEELFKKRASYPEIYNLPQEIIDYLKTSYGNKFRDIMTSFYLPSPMSIRFVGDREEVSKSLGAFGIRESKITDKSIIINRPFKINETPLYKKGIISIQGQGSIVAAEAFGSKIRGRLLDLCAAPGSKSLQLAQSLEDGSICSNDINSSKLSLIKENFARASFNNYNITNYDARVFIDQFKDSFDYVLVDAPCSALGLINRKPEIRLRRSMKDIENLREMQRCILKNAKMYLKKGGKLVFSTCTLGHIENDDNADYIKSLGFKEDIFNIRLGDFTRLTLFSDELNPDGFFVSKFVKK